MDHRRWHQPADRHRRPGQDPLDDGRVLVPDRDRRAVPGVPALDGRGAHRGLHRQSPRGVEGLLIRRSRFARISHCSSQFSAGWCDFRTGAHAQLLRGTVRIGSRCGDALLTQCRAFRPRKAYGQPGPGGAGEGGHPIVAPDTQSAGCVRAGGHRPRLASAGAQPPHEVSETPELDGYYDHADLSPWEKRPVR
jgi:hypothetical protein